MAGEVNAAGIARRVFDLRIANATAFNSAETAFGRAGIAVIAIILIRAIVLAATPLSFDEAYYWLWSKHLAAGYLDHPPLIAFLIRAGTILLGDSSAGVRAAPWLLSAAATWAVWRSATRITNRAEAGAISALLFNLMPMIAVESGVATPDSPEIAAAAFLLLFLTKIAETGYGPWWIAAGIAAGFALIAKYTGFFLGAGILVWLAAVPKQRRWFVSFWPYLGAAVALAMFAPVVAWNAQHGWISFAMQFGRTGAGAFTLRYLGEFLGGQLLLATPFIAALGAIGIIAAFRCSKAGDLRLIACLMIPGMAYFAWHSLHDRVQGNWPSFLYPGLAVAAAAVYLNLPENSRILTLLRRLTIPLAALLVTGIYSQALFDVIPGVRDPVSRLLAYGMDRVVGDIDGWRAQEHATAIVTTNYALTGWLSFYLPGHPPVIQLNERSRYLNEAPPDSRLFRGPLIYVSQVRNEKLDYLSRRFAHVAPLGRVLRTRNGAKIDEYAIYRLDGPTGEVLSFGSGERGAKAPVSLQPTSGP